MSASANALPVWLFVSYGGGHVKALLPVARQVRDLGIAQPVYLALTTAAAAVRESGIPVLGFKDFVTEADERALRPHEGPRRFAPAAPVTPCAHLQAMPQRPASTGVPLALPSETETRRG